MFEKLYPIIATVCDGLAGKQSLERAAMMVETLAPSERIAAPPIFMDETDRHKVIGTDSTSTLAIEWQRVDGNPTAQHSATRRFIFRNFLATPDGFFQVRSGHNRLNRPNFK